MTAEVIDAEVRDLPDERTVVVAQPGQALVARSDGPEAMVATATRLANALKAIVDRQRLYAVIGDKRYPTVEAWMTVARMDNVVAREAEAPIRHEDGSYEAFAELVRLSDGMVVGRASALCGTAGDRPWDKRPEPHRRSMAVTRATSRAFRQQYSWIMALAGYEPTPAEEMPRDEAATVSSPEREYAEDGGLIGTPQAGKPPSDFEVRQHPERDWSLSFRLRSGRKWVRVDAFGDLASALAMMRDQVEGKRVTVYGQMRDETFTPAGTTKEVTYQVLELERLATPDFILPANDESPTEAAAQEAPEGATPAAPEEPAAEAAVSGAQAAPEPDTIAPTGELTLAEFVARAHAQFKGTIDIRAAAVALFDERPASAFRGAPETWGLDGSEWARLAAEMAL